jgi:hypothetical protein
VHINSKDKSNEMKSKLTENLALTVPSGKQEGQSMQDTGAWHFTAGELFLQFLVDGNDT